MKFSTLATILAAGTAVNAVPVQQVNHEAVGVELCLHT